MAKPIGAKDIKRGNKNGLSVKDRPINDLAKPNGANQWRGNQQQLDFMELWLNPKSETFGNAYKSGLAVGYAPSYAKQIVAAGIANKWVQEFVDKNELSIEHVFQKLNSMVIGEIDSKSKDDTRLKAIELYSKLKGYLNKPEVGAATISINIDLNGSDERPRASTVIEVVPTPEDSDT